MRIRWKFFIVLLAFSIIPISIFNGIGYRSLKKMGANLSSEAHDRLTRIVSRELEETAFTYGQILLSNKKSIEMAVLALSIKAQNLLKEPPEKRASVYFVENYRHPEQAPPDLGPNPKYTVPGPGGVRRHTPVSFEQGVFALAPGTDAVAVTDDIRRIASILPSFKSINRDLSGKIYRCYVSLNNGVHFSYPGTPSFTEDYDGRKRPWYKNALESEGVSWSLPTLDNPTGGLVMTVSKTIAGPDGEVAGVVSADVTLDDVFSQAELISQWSNELESFLVSVEHNSSAGGENLLVIARKSQKTASTPGQLEWLGGLNELDYQKLMEDIRHGRFGFMETEYKGNKSIWAYSSLEGRLGLILRVPKTVVTGKADAMSVHIRGFLLQQGRTAGIGTIFLFMAIIIIALLGSRAITKPMEVMVDAWKRLAAGDFSVRMETRYGDERRRVFEAFNQTVPKLEEHMRMSRALGLAQEVQRNLLPDTMPELKGFDIAGTSVYCDETGGDYFDFFEIRRNGLKNLAVLVGDVSGHGVASALLMATVRGLIRQRASLPGEPGLIIGDINRHVSRDTYQTGQFMTLFYCEFEPEADSVHWVRAGHDPAIVYDVDSDNFDELKGEGLALGVMEDFKYTNNVHPISTGQVILIGTDGIWELQDSNGRMFGKKTLKRIIRENARKSADGILNSIMDELDEFRGVKEPEDDITMVVVKVQ